MKRFSIYKTILFDFGSFPLAEFDIFSRVRLDQSFFIDPSAPKRQSKPTTQTPQSLHSYHCQTGILESLGHAEKHKPKYPFGVCGYRKRHLSKTQDITRNATEKNKHAGLKR